MSNLTRNELFNIFKQSKTIHNRPPDPDLALKIVSERLCVVEDPQLKRDVNLISRNYSYYMQKQRTLNAHARGHETMSEVILFKEHYTSLLSKNLELPTVQPSKEKIIY